MQIGIVWKVSICWQKMDEAVASNENLLHVTESLGIRQNLFQFVKLIYTNNKPYMCGHGSVLQNVAKICEKKIKRKRLI